MFRPGTRSDRRFRVYHELMQHKVKEILLISSPYDAWVMEQDRGLSEAIVHEYRGLNLSHPPRLTWVASVQEATEKLQTKKFDLAIIIAEFIESLSPEVTEKLRKFAENIPVVRLFHRSPDRIVAQLEHIPSYPLERYFMWSGDTKLFLASIKSIEDELNAERDTHHSAIRVIIFVEDSAKYLSSLLPVLYQELVKQTQRVMEKGLNEEHRMLAMRVRPKILLASSFEGAIELFDRFEQYVLGVISDVRYSRNGKLDGNAGIHLLECVHKKRFDIPLLLTSSESVNCEKAKTIPASFVDKNSPSLHMEVRAFFLKKLGFGEFRFCSKDNREIARASDLRDLGNGLLQLPDDIFMKHWLRNDFSRWLFSRGETLLAQEIRAVQTEDFGNDLEKMRKYLHHKIHTRRMERQKGVIVDFDAEAYDQDTEFLKIGDGSLGGKARGLAFFSTWIDQLTTLRADFDQVQLDTPQTLILTTECFEEFIQINTLDQIIKSDISDEDIAEHFRKGALSDIVLVKLKGFLIKNTNPIAVRSSSLLEDSKYRAYAGLYSTYMLANDHASLETRLAQLTDAIKMVFASTYFERPRSFSLRVGNRIEEEKMAVIIQPIVGSQYNQYYYPAVSGVAQSHNYYPFGRQKSEDGIATIALGLGKAVMEGEKTLRFSPAHPGVLPQRSNVDDILDNSQRKFYALQLGEEASSLSIDEEAGLAERHLHDAKEEFPVRLLSSFYDPQSHSLRDSYQPEGIPVLTFSEILKYNLFPLSQMLQALLAEGQKAMRCPVEIEFSVDLPEKSTQKPRLAILQIRPMGAREELRKIDVDISNPSACFCISHNALGNIENTEMRDIVYVKPDVFDPACSIDIAMQIRGINAALHAAGRRYLLIGPGRWGSADHWLGIPVGWSDICEVGAIVEATHPLVHAEPSQGSHFFHNITSLGISYLNVGHHEEDLLDYQWLSQLSYVAETSHVIHAACSKAFTLKVDGRRSVGMLSK